MNERIRELEAQCWEHDQSWTGVGQRIFNREKFAELIIKEMCGMMEQCQDDISSDEPSEVNWGYVSQLGDWIERFKKHFGVLE